MVSQHRKKIDSTWKPEGLKLNKGLLAKIEASDLQVKDDMRKI